MKKTLIAFLVIFALVASTVPAMANDSKDTEIIADALFVRPFGLASIVIGSVVFVVALPFSIPTRSIGKVGQIVVVDPCKYTFVRPMGEF